MVRRSLTLIGGLLISLLDRVICCSSYFSGANWTLLASPHWSIFLISSARNWVFRWKDRDALYRHISSAYPERKFSSCFSSSARYSMYNTGDRGEPCGIPHLELLYSVVAASSRTRTRRSDRNEPTSCNTFSVQPCFLIRSRSRRFSKASNAPCTSIVTIEIL